MTEPVVSGAGKGEAVIAGPHSMGVLLMVALVNVTADSELLGVEAVEAVDVDNVEAGRAETEVVVAEVDRLALIGEVVTGDAIRVLSSVEANSLARSLSCRLMDMVR